MGQFWWLSSTLKGGDRSLWVPPWKDWWCLLSISDLTVWGWLLGEIYFQCWVLGKERIENREERGTAKHGHVFWRKKKASFAFIGFWKRFLFFCFYVFFFLVSEKFFFLCLCFFFILNIVLMWKIVGASKTSVLYIYIYI